MFRHHETDKVTFWKVMILLKKWQKISAKKDEARYDDDDAKDRFKIV
jgi:hypothetical protein